MSTRTLPSPVGTSALDAAYDCTNTWLAVLSSDHVRVLRREDPSRSFHPHAVLQLDEADRHVTSLAWARPEQGPLLAAGTSDGHLLLWAGDQASHQPSWTRIARLQAGKASLRQLAFDPSPDARTCSLAAACSDGFVRFFERDVRNPSRASWEPCNDFRCRDTFGAPTALSWREPDDDSTSGAALPPLLLVGTARGQAAVWWLRKQTGSWVKAIDLPLQGPGGKDDPGTMHGDQPGTQGQQGVSSVAWSSVLGRSHETVAVARGPAVTLCTLRGATDALEVECLAVLPHGSPVWQVEWNPLGTWLAASTEAGQVCLWRPDFGGEWKLCNSIYGETPMQE